jgi:hypothetical protein
MISEVPLKRTTDILQKVNAIRFAIRSVYIPHSIKEKEVQYVGPAADIA